MRLARTEINMAYRTADYERFQQLDFVVGFKVVLSNNHTCKGVKGIFVDICDELQGEYPKDFKFVGWHPHCRCHVEAILSTEDEIKQNLKDILQGKETELQSVNEVRELPDNFKNWLKNNAERSMQHYSMPYFIRDNKKYVPQIYRDAYGMRNAYDTFAEYEKAMRYNAKNANFSKEQLANIRELNKVLPVMQGQIMDIAKADTGKPNPNFDIKGAKVKGYRHNCQTCTMAYELRRRGFDVEAMRSPSSNKSKVNFYNFCERKGLDWHDRFLEQDGSRPKYTWSTELFKNNIKSKVDFIENSASKTGRYEIYCEWKNGGAHVFCLERQSNGNLLWIDPQSGKKGGAKVFNDYIKLMRHTRIGVMRIDDKIINPAFAERLLRSEG